MSLPMALMDDSPPYLSFRRDCQTLEDRTKTNETGRFTYKDVEMVEITPRGDSKTMIEHEVSEWLEHLKDRRRANQISENYFNYCTRAYEQWKEKGEVPVDGTPILGWPLASPAQQKTILDANIKTVEDLAKAPEDAIQAIGMGARELQRKAASWVKQAEGQGVAAAQHAAMVAELETLRSREKERAEAYAKVRAELDELKKGKG